MLLKNYLEFSGKLMLFDNNEEEYPPASGLKGIVILNYLGYWQSSNKTPFVDLG